MTLLCVMSFVSILLVAIYYCKYVPTVYILAVREITSKVSVHKQLPRFQQNETNSE